MKFKMGNDEWLIQTISNKMMNEIENAEEGEFIQGVTRYAELKVYINDDAPNKEVTLYHELMHCYMFEYGHNQWHRTFNNEDVCEISASAYPIIREIVKKYLDKEKY